MKPKNYKLRLVFGLFAIIGSVTLSARIAYIKHYHKFYKYASANYPLTAILCYTRPKKLEREKRNTIKTITKSFKKLSYQTLYKNINMAFATVNLAKVEELTDDYQLEKNPDIAYLLLFKRGELTANIELAFELTVTRESFYKQVKTIINKEFKEIIFKRIKAFELHQKELQKQAAQRPLVVDYRPWWWNYSTYHPRYNRRFHSPFWFY